MLINEEMLYSNGILKEIQDYYEQLYSTRKDIRDKLRMEMQNLIRTPVPYVLYDRQRWYADNPTTPLIFFQNPMGTVQNDRVKGRWDTNLTHAGYLPAPQIFSIHNSITRRQCKSFVDIGAYYDETADYYGESSDIKAHLRLNKGLDESHKQEFIFGQDLSQLKLEIKSNCEFDVEIQVSDTNLEKKQWTDIWIELYGVMYRWNAFYD